MNGRPIQHRRPFVLCAFGILLLLALCACSNRASIAARATVETFYSAVQNDNMPLAEDNLAQSATPQFRARVEEAAAAAQSGGAAQQAVQLVRVDPPVINGDRARIHVLFADGRPDEVTLVREGLRWKVLTSGRLE
jgi:hypothetical protein